MEGKYRDKDNLLVHRLYSNFRERSEYNRIKEIYLDVLAAAVAL
jgi:hypothetical protein